MKSRYTLLLIALMAASQYLCAAVLTIKTNVPTSCLINYQRPSPKIETTHTFKNLSASANQIVKLIAPGYQPYQAIIPLDEERPTHLKVTLIPTCVPFLITSTVPAKIFKDDEYIGDTPFSSLEYSADKHYFTLRADGFLDTRTLVDLTLNKPVHKAVNMLTNSGKITFDTIPHGATVIVNGAPIGTTPCEINKVPVGKTTLAIHLEHYEPQTHTVTLNAGQVIKMDAITLRPKPSALTIHTIEPQCKVYVNGEFKGVSDLTLNGLKPGAYRLRVEKAGFVPMFREITLKPNASVTEEFRIATDRGTLYLQTIPQEATLSIGDHVLGKTKAGNNDTYSEPTSFILTSGKHAIKVSAPQHAPTMIMVDIKRGGTISKKVALKRIFTPDYFVITAQRTRINGVLIEKTPTAIKLELSPGVIRAFKLTELRLAGPLLKD